MNQDRSTPRDRPRLLTVILVTLALLATGSVPLAGAEKPSEDLSGSAWPEARMAALDSESIENANISLSHQGTHLRDVRFPKDSGNHFMEFTGGGNAYGLRYDGTSAGIFHSNVYVEGYQPHGGDRLVNREHTFDGRLSMVSAATIGADNGSYFTVSHWFRNNGDAPLDLMVYEIVEPNANSQDDETTSRDDQTGVISSTNGHGSQATLGMVPCLPTAGHSIGDINILYGLEDGTMNNASSYTGDGWYIDSVAPPTVPPGGSVQVDFVFRAALSGDSVDDAADFCPSASAPPVAFIDPPPAPANDDFVDAVQIADLPYVANQTTVGATTEANETAPCGVMGATVWYTYTPAEDATVSINTFDSDYDTVLAVYTGPSLEELAVVGCNDDSQGLQSRVAFDATSGTTYHIQVGGFYGDQGELGLNVYGLSGDAPENDARADAIVIPERPYANSQSTFAATLEAGEPRPCGGMDATVWYTYTAGPSELGTVTIDTFGSDYDTVLAVYTEVAGRTLQLGCNDDSEGLQSSVSFVALPGATYWIQAGGYYGEVGTLVLNVD